MIFIDYAVTDDCKNLDGSYGEICVQCNRCGRFDKDKTKEIEDKIDEIFNEEFKEG